MEPEWTSSPIHQPALTPQTIVDAALALAEENGLPAVSIRRLASRLGVTPMAIYWHFPNKDALLDAMASRILDSVPLPLDPSAAWALRLRQILGDLLAALREQPAIAPLLSTRTLGTTSALAMSEALLDALRHGGFSPDQATQIARHAVSSICNFVWLQPGVVAQEESGAQARARREAQDMLATLPIERYPRLVEATSALTEAITPDAYDAFGLDLLLAGIEAMAPTSPGP